VNGVGPVFDGGAHAFPIAGGSEQLGAAEREGGFGGGGRDGHWPGNVVWPGPRGKPVGGGRPPGAQRPSRKMPSATWAAMRAGMAEPVPLNRVTSPFLAATISELPMNKHPLMKPRAMRLAEVFRASSRSSRP